MRWVNSQLGRVLGWVERAIQQEVSIQVCFIYASQRVFLS